jgi:predicted nucleic acid-binding protein
VKADIAVDTNILAYAEGVGSDDRRTKSDSLLRRIPRERIVIPAQVLGELFNVLLRSGRSRTEARRATTEWRANVDVAPTSGAVLTAALEPAVQHQLQIWDAIILAAAAWAGCTLLLSEDFQHGFAWGAVTVVNPFAEPQHPLLTSVVIGQ